MSLWQRFSFIIIYILIFVFSSCVLEWFLLYETGFTSYQIVEPLRNLSVSQLQALLSSRGIQYSNYVEKWEIIDSLHHSGNVHYLELLGAQSNPEPVGPIEIIGKDEFHEQVLEENESIWVIEIIPENELNSGKRLLDSASWKELNEKLKLIGINTAIIRCKKEPQLCSRQDWNSPQLLMAVPSPQSSTKLKFKLASSAAAPQLSVNAVMKWIQTTLSKLLKNIESIQELESQWLNTTLIKETKIPRMIYFSELLNPPLLLVAFGLRFSSRIRMSIFNVRLCEKEVMSKTLTTHKLCSPPGLVVTCEDSVTQYGSRKGEFLTTNSLDIFVRLLKPRMNDVFLISLMVTNFFAFVDFLDFRGSVWKHIFRSLFSIPAYNIFVFITWLTLSAIVKFYWMQPIVDYGGWVIQEMGLASIPGVLLYPLVVVDHFKWLGFVNLLLFCVIVYWCKRLLGVPLQVHSNQDGDNWYTVFPMDSYLVNVLFRPMASLSRPRPSHDLDLEEGMERLIQRLATPDLWLHPVLPTEYLKELPTWRYDGWGNEDDLKSESETDFDSLSETDNESLLDTHTCCQDEGCKMCSLWATVKETYVCHRCALLKRKLEKKYIRSRNAGDAIHQNCMYEKLLKVCDNCARTKKTQNAGSQSSKPNTNPKNRRQWLISSQRLHELKWSAPAHAIESRVCAICLDKYRWSAVLCGLPCGHTYHHSCIMEWLSKDNHQCPTCRWPSYKNKI